MSNNRSIPFHHCVCGTRSRRQSVIVLRERASRARVKIQTRRDHTTTPPQLGRPRSTHAHIVSSPAHPRDGGHAHPRTVLNDPIFHPSFAPRFAVSTRSTRRRRAVDRNWNFTREMTRVVYRSSLSRRVASRIARTFRVHRRIRTTKTIHRRAVTSRSSPGARFSRRCFVSTSRGAFQPRSPRGRRAPRVRSARRRGLARGTSSEGCGRIHRMKPNSWLPREGFGRARASACNARSFVRSNSNTHG